MKGVAKLKDEARKYEQREEWEKAIDAYRSDPAILVDHETLSEALPIVRQSNQLEFPVVNPSNEVVGVLTWGGIKSALADRSLPGETPVRELAQPFIEGVTLSDDLLTALRRLGARGAQMLPVIDRVAPHHLRGIIGRQEIFAAFGVTVATPGEILANL